MKEHELKVVSIRLVEEPSFFSTEPLNTPQKVIERIGREFRDYDREVFGILNMATDQKVMSLNIVSVGTLNAALVSPREVFKSSILSNACGIIAIHNHVSGNVAPSKEDIEVTKRLIVAGEYLDIPLLDHIILGKDNYFSFEESARISEYKNTLKKSPDLLQNAYVSEPLSLDGRILEAKRLSEVKPSSITNHSYGKEHSYR